MVYFGNYQSYFGVVCVQLPIFPPAEFTYKTLKHFHTWGVQNFGTLAPKRVQNGSQNGKIRQKWCISETIKSYLGVVCVQLPIFDPTEFIYKI